MIPDSPGAARCPGESFFIGCRKTAHGEELRVFRLHTIRLMSAVREDTERKDENAEDSAGYGYRRRHRRRGLLGVPAARAAVRAARRPTVCGESEKRAAGADALCRAAGRQVPVVAGPDRPLQPIPLYPTPEGAGALALHDPLAAAAVFHPELLRFARGFVRVETARRDRMAETAFTPDAGGNVEIARSVEKKNFYALLSSTLNK